jgi:hypothetical protein
VVVAQLDRRIKERVVRLRARQRLLQGWILKQHALELLDRRERLDGRFGT